MAFRLAFVFIAVVCGSAWTGYGTELSPLPKSQAAQLPIRASLANLCPGAEGASDPRRFNRRLRRQAKALIETLRTHPYSTIVYTYETDEDPGDVRERITVRELAEISLDEFDLRGPRCQPHLAARIRSAL